MKYCYKCGCQIEDNDVFCGNCGAKQAQDSGVNEKNSNNNKENQNYRTNQGNYSTVSSINLSSAKDILLKMLIKPIYASKKFMEDKDKNTVTVISILSILFYGILGVWKIKQLFYSTQNIIVDALQKAENVYKLFSNDRLGSSTSDINEAMIGINKIKQSIDIPYGKIFFQNCIIFAVLVLIIFIFISVGTNITNHKQTSALEMYKISLIALIPFLYFKALSILVSYVSNYAGIAIQLIGIIISIGCLFVLIKDVLGVKEDCSLFIVSICFVVICVAYLFCISKFLYSDIQQIITSLKGISF